jgi:hypothetical protein
MPACGYATAEATRLWMSYIFSMQPDHPLHSSLTERLREEIETTSKEGAIERAFQDVDDEKASMAKRVAARIFLATEGYEEYQ